MIGTYSVSLLERRVLYLFSVSLLLTIATQLRFFGPIGIGEVGLVLSAMTWLLLKAISQCKNWRTNEIFLLFWPPYFFALMLGWAFSFSLGLADIHHALHDVLAILFSFLLLVIFYTGGNGPKNYSEIIVTTSYCAVLIFLPLYFFSMFTASLFGLQFWFHGVNGGRWVGLAENPNQLALLFAPLPFVFISMMSQAYGYKKLYPTLGLLAVLPIGNGTESDALLIAWGGGFLTMFSFWLLSNGRQAYKTAILVLFLAVLGGGVLLYWDLLVVKAMEMYELGGQGGFRVMLWRHALEAFEHSPVFGLGPGAFSGDYGPFGDREAHNTWIDLATNTGLVGAVAYFFLHVVIFWKIVKTFQIALAGVIVSLFLFSMFHYVFRQPLYWFFLFGAYFMAIHLMTSKS